MVGGIIKTADGLLKVSLSLTLWLTLMLLFVENNPGYSIVSGYRHYPVSLLVIYITEDAYV